MGILWWFSAFLRSRNGLGLEIVALRQQVSVLKRKNPRLRLSSWDRMFWVFLRRVWSRWAGVLLVVKPATVIRWHRGGFRLYWRLLSRRKEMGRPRISSELRELIERMAKENPCPSPKLDLAENKRFHGGNVTSCNVRPASDSVLAKDRVPGRHFPRCRPTRDRAEKAALLTGINATGVEPEASKWYGSRLLPGP
jgi:hypothetical protein